MWNRFVCAYFTTNPPPPFLYKFPSFIEVEKCTTFVQGDLIFDSFCFNSTWTLSKFHPWRMLEFIFEKLPILEYGNQIFFTCFKNEFNWLWFRSFDYLSVIRIRAGGFIIRLFQSNFPNRYICIIHWQICIPLSKKFFRTVQFWKLVLSNLYWNGPKFMLHCVEIWNFPTTQILREINFYESGVSKS